MTDSSFLGGTVYFGDLSENPDSDRVDLLYRGANAEWKDFKP